MNTPSSYRLKYVAAATLMACSAWALADGNADAAFTGYTKAFLVDSNGSTYFRQNLNTNDGDGTWVASLDIFVAEDAYDQTGRPAYKTLVDKLCRTWLDKTPMPWAWDGWNDDIGWFSLGLIRGYQITGQADYLAAAKYGFDMAWARGWNVQYNGGGIWEQQDNMTPAGQAINKAALSNDSLGKVAVMLYQSTHDQWYLDRARQIHDWVVAHLFNAGNGQVYAAIDRANVIDKGTAVYSQGTFADFSNLLYLATGDSKYRDDARKAIDFTRASLTSNGIVTHRGTDNNTWADEMARGLGNFVRDNREWNTYYGWMQQNAAAIWNNRRTDYNITWNGWDLKTSGDNGIKTSQFASAVSWLEFTPASKPNDIGGIHSIVNKLSGIAIDNGGQNNNGAGVIQWGLNYGQNQKWLLTQNEDTSWNIVSMSSWRALDVPGGNTANGMQLIQWAPSRNDNQRWWIDVQADGSYKIWNKATGAALDGSSSSANGFKLVQWAWNGGDQQRWSLK